MNILLTGAAGFIGSHTAEALLAAGHSVVGLDNLDPFYDPELKVQNLKIVSDLARRIGGSWSFLEADLNEPGLGGRIMNASKAGIDGVVHLAAKGGVRASILDPYGFQMANVNGTQALLEFARGQGISPFVFASSSSVYGINPKRPWSVEDPDLRPISPYASTKLSCELLGHVYSHLYPIRFIGLRFFTVYGPRQRPDLAIRKFMTRIEWGESIPVFGDGSTSRDYTYVDDVVQGILAALHYEGAAFDLFNLGNDSPVSLNAMIETIERVVGKAAILDRQGEQAGDVPHTLADISKTRELLGYNPQTTFEEGIRKMWGGGLI